MPTKTLLIAVIRKGDSILMRKKPDGSLPYKETWYLFGAEEDVLKGTEETLKEWAKNQTGVEIKLVENVGEAKEVKRDLDGIEKDFTYKDWICEYVSGELKPAEGIERLEWIPINKLNDYDIVPPARELFKRLGYLK